jgi:histidine triad (HIT) family protein
MPDEQLTEEDLSKMSPQEIAELQKKNCVFCKIINKEIPAKIIHEDANTMCVLDTNPAAEGHILILPKQHYMIMPHIPDDVLAKVFTTVKLMSHTLLKSLQCPGTTVFIANGVAAGQKAPHVLIHVFPRRENDGLVKLPDYDMSEEQIDKLKKTIGTYTSQVFGPHKSLNTSSLTMSKSIDADFVDVNSSKSIATKPKKSLSSKKTTVIKKIKSDKSSDESDDADTDASEDDSAVADDDIANLKDYNSEDNTLEDDDSDNKKDKNNNKKIDLDDISRLFG